MRATQVNWRLAPEDLHVWTVPLTAAPETVDQLSSLLSDDELERAGRFRLPHLGPRFIVGRGRQREILASYLEVEPAAVRFSYSRLGKPDLAAPFDAAGLRFNASNSDELAILAVTVDREIGVDVERLRPVDDFEELARQYFAPEEREALSELPPDDRLDGFFRCWTRKEAILKALGKGLSGALDLVVVSLAADEPARVISIDGDERASHGWWLHSMSPADGFVAAVATTGGAPSVQTWQYSSATSRPDAEQRDVPEPNEDTVHR